MAALRRIPLVLVTALVVACGSTSAPTASPSRSIDLSRPGLTPVPGAPTATPAASPPTTTATEFGTIYDALPPSFPKLPGQEPADTGGGPTSGSFAIPNLSADDAARTMAGALATLGWTADVTSALEDGTVVLEASRPTGGCKTEVRFTPRSGTVVMSVLYGASCPFS